MLINCYSRVPSDLTGALVAIAAARLRTHNHFVRTSTVACASAEISAAATDCNSFHCELCLQKCYPSSGLANFCSRANCIGAVRVAFWRSFAARARKKGAAAAAAAAVAAAAALARRRLP